MLGNSGNLHNFPEFQPFFGKAIRIDHTGSAILVWQQYLGAGVVYTFRWQGGNGSPSGWLQSGPWEHLAPGEHDIILHRYNELHRYLRTNCGICWPICPCSYCFLSLTIMGPTVAAFLELVFQFSLQ